MPIYEYQQGSYQFNWSVGNILQNCENICQDAVDYDYIEKKIQSCDFLFVNYEPVTFKLTGFAIVFNYSDELYIDVICNLPKNNNKSFSNSIYNLFFSQYGGKDIINKIKDKGIAMGKKRIGLKALRPVISYYSHLGFTFPYKGHDERRIEKIKKFKELMNKYEKLEKERDEIFKKEENDYDYERTQEEKETLKAYNKMSTVINNKIWEFDRRYQPGRFKEPDLRSKLQETDNVSDKIHKIYNLEIDGIKMIFDLSQKKTSSSLSRKTRRRNPSMSSNNNVRSHGSRSRSDRGSRSRSDRGSRSRSNRNI
jgi:hypothetical protein